MKNVKQEAYDNHALEVSIKGFRSLQAGVDAWTSSLDVLSLFFGGHAT
jgi:hypothetical protein